MDRCVMSLGRILSFREDTFLYEVCVSSGTDVNILLFVRTFFRLERDYLSKRVSVGRLS